MKRTKKYALWLFLACLAALIAGWVVGGMVETQNPSESLTTSDGVTDWATVKGYGVEAQGTYLSYNDYEASVLDEINDRKKVN